MIKHADITLQNNILSVKGQLCFANVMSVYQQSLALLDQCPEWVFDFAGVTESDSAGLALIIEWIKLAKRKNRSVRFNTISQDLMSIARASGLASVINA